MDAWPFEGREEELALIRTTFLGTQKNALMFTAPAGMGKTRLARHALSTLEATTKVWVGATRAAASVPLGAVAELFPDDAPAGGPVELMCATLRHLRKLGGRRQVAIVVDDAHLLDDASSTLIAHMVTSKVAFVIITVRSGERTPDVLLKLCKESHARRVDLPPLSEEAIDRLLAAAGAIEPQRRRKLLRLADGNPLALRELMHGAEPGGLGELVTARLDGLDQMTRHAVEIVACGEPLPVSLVEQLAGLAALTRAEDSGLIVVERYGERKHARLDHPLYGEVLRSRMSLSRATHLHRLLAEALLRTPLRRRQDMLLAALWQVEGGTVTRPDVVRSGALLAIGHADLALAERLARVACAAEPCDEADRLLAEILAYRGRVDEATNVLPASPPVDQADRIAWAVTRAETLYWGDGEAVGAQAILDTAEGHVVAEAARSWLLFFDGRCVDAARVAALVLSDPTADAKAVIWASAAGSAAAGFLGDPDAAAEIHKRGVPIAFQHRDAVPWGPFEVDTGGCLAHLAGGQPIDAQAITRAGYKEAIQGGAVMMVCGWALYDGLVSAARGHLDDAKRMLTEALSGFEVNDTFRLARCCVAALAAVCALRGDPEAQSLMARADALAHPSNRVFEPWIEMWRGWCEYARGDLPSAINSASRAADLAHAAGMPAVEALALYDLARLGTQPDLSRLDAIDNDLAMLLAGAARAMSSEHGARVLEAVAQELHERGYDLHAAEAYAAAARQHRRHRSLAQADITGAKAARLRELAAGARTPLLQLGHLTSLLSPRETQVLLMAAKHTSVQIADRLQLAVSTVNNNLARAYAKLGITGRTELRDILESADATDG